MEATVKPSAAMAMMGHEGVKRETMKAQVAATAGLRKNLKVSKPSTGASFQAPPKAEIQPKKLPTVRTVSQRGQVAPQRSSRARMATKTPTHAMATRMPMVMRLRASFIGLPMMPNWIGMKYLLWSSSRMKYFQNS